MNLRQCSGIVLAWVALSGAPTARGESPGSVETLSDAVEARGWQGACPQVEKEIGPLLAAARPKTPEWASLVLLKAGCLSEARRDGEAAALLEDAVQRTPNDGLLLESLGNSYLRLGRDPEAADALSKAAQFRLRGSVHSKLALAYWRLAESLDDPSQAARKNELLEQAEAAIRTAIELDTVLNSPEHIGQLASIVAARGRYDEAVEFYREALRLAARQTRWDAETKDARMAEYHAGLGETYHRMGDQANARQHLDQGIALAPTPELKRRLEAVRDSALGAAKNLPHSRPAEVAGEKPIPGAR